MSTVHALRRYTVTLWAVLYVVGGLMPPRLYAHIVSPPLGYVPAPPGTYALPVIKPATDGEVLDHAGTPRRLFQYMDGKIVLLSFIYTRCSDARGCPLATSVFYAIEDALQHDATLAQQVRLLTLSFDPEHDTPDVMRRYAGADKTTPASQLWYRLTTASPQALQPLLDGYGQYIAPILDSAGRSTGTYTHLLKVFLIDPQQRVRNIYSVDFLHPQVLLNDIKTVLMAPGQAQVR
jgi:cytochrome c peroxidase